MNLFKNKTQGKIKPKMKRKTKKKERKIKKGTFGSCSSGKFTPKHYLLCNQHQITFMYIFASPIGTIKIKIVLPSQTRIGLKHFWVITVAVFVSGFF